MLKITPVLLLMLCAAAAGGGSSAAGAPNDSPAGITMNVKQTIEMGDLSQDNSFQCWLLPPDRLRMEGAVYLRAMEMKAAMTLVSGDGRLRQLMESPIATQAIVLDLNRIAQVLPELRPAEMYNPLAFYQALSRIPGKTTLPAAVMDGVPVEGYEFPGDDMLPPQWSAAAGSFPKPGKARVWIAAADRIPRKVEAQDTAGNVFLRMTYENVKTGATIPLERFKLEFPKGVAPVDMTDAVISNLQSARQSAPGAPPSPDPPPAGGRPPPESSGR